MAAINLFDGYARSLTAPAEFGEAVTPSDDNELYHVTRALRVTADGNLTVEMKDRDGWAILDYGPVFAGETLDIQVRKVRATGTTATVIALW